MFKQLIKSALVIVAMACCAAMPVSAQKPERPKLVVGLVIDQMRWDYLYRYQTRYGDGGFNRLLSEGYSCENTRLPYIPAITAVGHASIYTGSVPSINGIAANSLWIGGKFVGCVSDKSVRTLGAEGKAGEASPRNLVSNTIGDELRIATNGRSKVIGVALKDRASILPAGHSANGAYWFDDKSGNFVSSSYYMDELPAWVKDFNAKRLPDAYLKGKWQLLYDANSYAQSAPDANDFEMPLAKEVEAVFPIDLTKLKKQEGYGVLRNLPAGNNLTFDMATAAIEGERLGQRGETDFIAISCSSTDYLGHKVATHAMEIEDMYLRLDKRIEEFLNFLDAKVGKGNYLMFLTADHGAMNNPGYMRSLGMPAGSWDAKKSAESIREALKKVYPQAGNLVVTVSNYQVYFDKARIDSLGLSYEAVKQVAVDAAQKDPMVLYAVDFDKVRMSSLPDEVIHRIVNGYNRERSGGVQIITKPGFYDYGMKGTTHGMWNGYDTHIPLVFYGWHVEHGATTRECHVTDIAATVAALLRIQAPNGCVGKPVF